MKNHKNLLIITTALLFTIFSSCKSTDANIITMFQNPGQLVFLRQVTLDDKKFVLRNTEFDMTVIIVDFKLTDDNTVNYTIHYPMEYLPYAETTEFFFTTPSVEKISVENKKILYKDINKNKNVEIRYTSTVSAESLSAMLENPSQTKVGLTINGKTMIFSSPEFSQKLFELGVLVE